MMFPPSLAKKNDRQEYHRASLRNGGDAEAAFFAGFLRFLLALPRLCGYSSFGSNNPIRELQTNLTHVTEKEIRFRWQSQ
jgi:hypothetical protein